MAANGVMRVEPTVSKANQCTTKDCILPYSSTVQLALHQIHSPLPDSGIRREQTKTDPTLCMYLLQAGSATGAGCRLRWGCQLCSCQIHVSMAPAAIGNAAEKLTREAKKKSKTPALDDAHCRSRASGVSSAHMHHITCIRAAINAWHRLPV